MQEYIRENTAYVASELSKLVGVSQETLFTIILIFGAWLTMLTTITVITEHRRKNFPKVPGKLGLPWWGSTGQFLTSSTSWLTQSHQKYGDIFKSVVAGEQYLFVIGNDLLEQTAGSTKSNKFTNGLLPAAKYLFGPESLLGSNFEQHKFLKRIYTRVFGSVNQKEYFPKVIPVLLRRFREWESTSEKPKHLNIFPLIKQTMLEANLTLLMGADVIKPSEVPGFIEDLRVYNLGIMALPIYVPGTAYYNAVQACDRMKARISKEAEKRKDATDKSALSLFVNTVDTETGKTLTTEAIAQNLVTAMFASQDTTVGKSYIMLYRRTQN
jgi:cytochrome P450